MEPTIYKQGTYKTPGVYKGAGSIYKGRGVYNDGEGGGGATANIGGRNYKIVTMPDGKTWIAENLDYKFSGCDISPAGTPTTPAAWYYDNDESTYSLDGIKKCGLLYNWYAAKLLNDNRSTLCPGWHVPDSDEFRTLVLNVGNGAGARLKSLDNSVVIGFPSGWNGTDEYGFNALPAGRRNDTSFMYLNNQTVFWAADEATTPYGNCLLLNTSDNAEHTFADKSQRGFSIRLVKDA